MNADAACTHINASWDSGMLQSHSYEEMEIAFKQQLPRCWRRLLLPDLELQIVEPAGNPQMSAGGP